MTSLCPAGKCWHPNAPNPNCMCPCGHPGSSSPAIWDLVQADMAERDRNGVQTYGKRLYAHDGRDSLRDLYEELLDACVYIRKAMYERDGR